MIPILALSPFILALLAAPLGKNARWVTVLAIWPAVLALCFGGMMHTVAESGPVTASLPWADSLGLILSFYADGLSLLFATLISGIGSLIVLFTGRYFEGDPRRGRFLATLFAFMGSMLGVVLADNLFALFVFWELTGFTSYLLIGFDNDRTEARASAQQALIVTGTGGMGLLAAAVLIEMAAGSHDISVLISRTVVIHESPAYEWIALLVLLAAFTKSAQTPFHFWLPNAMTAPTPVSAYLHSATMVKAGLYLVARTTPLLGDTALWTGVVATAGAVTMAVGAWRAVAETDLKRVLAYSTVSALGLLMMLLGFGTGEAVTAAFVYLVAHACYKGALFLIAGTLEHETGTRDILELGGLRSAMPGIALAGLLAALSMAGLPFFAGFVGKELTYEALLSQTPPWSLLLLTVAFGASALLGAAGLIAGVSPFIGQVRRAAPAHRVPAALAIPPLVLAGAGLVAGLYPAILDMPLRLTTISVVRRALPVHLALWHGFTIVLLLSILTLVAAAALYVCRDRVRRRIWPRSFRFERLYTGGLRILDVLSARSLPALQDASLRSYVLVLIVTAASLITGVLAWTGLPAIPRVTEVHPAEAAVALMTIAGAISAVRARATITAVLSLGVAGYGVALTFLFFGAPDLAMTQFSVETLTAVIFTLVFYHFRRFRSLSKPIIRMRDLSIAILFGGSLAAVLFFVGAATTPFGLGRYFAENSAVMAHGRNIVNVILVDFRALDTMGEITVLATAALGVRALLQIGRREERKP
jgi:multicomponent Na+:H+ antiporter subunit A